MIDWRQWHSEPLLVDGLVLLAWIYALLTGPLRGRIASGEAFPKKRAASFYAGLLVAYVAVGSPFERVGQLYLFSVHVLLEMLIVYAAAGLILKGLPPWLLRPVTRWPGLRWLLFLLTRPVIAGALFVLVFSGSYAPRMFEWSLRPGFPAEISACAFLGVGIVFWWPLVSPSDDFPALKFGARMVYLFCLEVALAAVFSYILMAEHPMYPTYDLAPRLIPGLDALDDQVLGGVFVSALSSLVLVGTLGVNFLSWAKKSDH